MCRGSYPHDHKNEAALQQNRIPADWQGWAALVHAALLPGPDIPPEQLLLVQDLAGNNIRPLAPPEGVDPRRGAVLALLYPDGRDLRLPLTVRSDRLPNHRGEVSFPGGAVEPEDSDAAATALRECYEELGIEPRSIEVWGTLSSIYISPSNFQITPAVGYSASMPVLHLNTDEVSKVITVTLRELLDPATVVIEQWNLRGYEVRVPFFLIEGHKVWGATALVLSELVARMRRALQEGKR